MSKLFNLDSPILRVLGTLADMCILNIDNTKDISAPIENHMASISFKNNSLTSD